jgi:hypothetical protein
MDTSLFESLSCGGCPRASGHGNRNHARPSWSRFARLGIVATSVNNGKGDEVQDDDVERLCRVVPLWRTTRAWAEDLLCDALGLARARDVLEPKYRGQRRVPGTKWFYRTHDNGVDIDLGDTCGGIDFEFDEVRPDAGRLRMFVQKQLNAGELPAEYAELVEDEARFERAAHALFASDKASFEEPG